MSDPRLDPLDPDPLTIEELEEIADRAESESPSWIKQLLGLLLIPLIIGAMIGITNLIASLI
jgi:hypothetical protein